MCHLNLSRHSLVALVAAVFFGGCGTSPPVSAPAPAPAPAQSPVPPPFPSSTGNAAAPSAATANPPRPTARNRDPEACRRGFNVTIESEGGVIVRHQVTGYDEGIGRLRFAGKYAYPGDQIYFRFKSSACPDTYWLMLTEVFQNGARDIRASSVLEPDIRLRRVAPPCTVAMAVTIRSEKVVQHDILSPEPGWGPFQFESFARPVATFSAWHYPGCRWLAKFPTTDGQGRVFMQFEAGSCEDTALSCTRPD